MRIRFLPGRPKEQHFIRLALRRLGWARARDDRHADLGFKWKDATRAENPPELLDLAKRVPVLNQHASDIGKSTVHRIYSRCFDQPFALNPTTHRGQAVRKSERNYAHDGVIVDCPLTQPEPDVTYAKLIDNSRDPSGRRHSDLVFDLRTPYFRGAGIPYVLVKYKQRELRFGAGSSSAPAQGRQYELLRPEEVFSAEEKTRIESFCSAMGLDVCELDILRDADDTPYIIDANWTPATPTRTLSAADRRWVINAWSEAFEACVRGVALHPPRGRLRRLVATAQERFNSRARNISKPS